MRYQYVSDLSDFKQAQRTLIRSSTFRRVRFHLLMWGLVLTGVLLIFVFSQWPQPKGTLLDTLEAGLVGGCLGGGVVTPLLRPWLLRRAYRNLRSGPRHDAPVFLEISAGVLRSGYEGTSEGVFQRSAICGHAEDSTTLLLFVTRQVFLYLPKRRLPTDAIEEVHTWLAGPVEAKSC